MAPNPSYKSRKCRYCKERWYDDKGVEHKRELLWPPHDEYILCPLCHEETLLSVTMPTRTWQDLESERKEHEFGWYLLESWLSTTSSPSTA